MANLKSHKVTDFKYFRQENGIKSDCIYFYSHAYKVCFLFVEHIQLFFIL